jgi:hypothetical protein
MHLIWQSWAVMQLMLNFNSFVFTSLWMFEEYLVGTLSSSKKLQICNTIMRSSTNGSKYMSISFPGLSVFYRLPIEGCARGGKF